MNWRIVESVERVANDDRMDTADDTRDASITGIDITPLVDVTLVLLIVFLVTAKAVVTESIPFEVPRASKATTTQTILAVRIDASGSITVDDRPTATDAELVHAASEARARDNEVRAVIRAAETASHGSVVRAIDALRAAGVTKIAFAAARENREPR